MLEAASEKDMVEKILLIPNSLCHCAIQEQLSRGVRGVAFESGPPDAGLDRPTV